AWVWASACSGVMRRLRARRGGADASSARVRPALAWVRPSPSPRFAAPSAVLRALLAPPRTVPAFVSGVWSVRVSAVLAGDFEAVLPATRLADFAVAFPPACVATRVVVVVFVAVFVDAVFFVADFFAVFFVEAFFAVALFDPVLFPAAFLVVARLVPLAAALRAGVFVACFKARPAPVDFFAAFVADLRAAASSRSTSRSRVSKRSRMSAIRSALSLLRWLAAPLLPRLLPVLDREASFCRRTRSRARSRAARARVTRAASARPSSWRRPLIRLSS